MIVWNMLWDRQSNAKAFDTKCGLIPVHSISNHQAQLSTIASHTADINYVCDSWGLKVEI